MYPSVPITLPALVAWVASRPMGSIALAMPKSMIRGAGLPSISVTSTLEGFRSRWMIALRCACCTPSQTCMNRASRAGSGSCLASQYSVIGWPSTYSMTKYGCPSGVEPASKTLAIVGCSMIARACRSASKRLSRAASKRPARTSLRATRRVTGSVCSASQT